MSKARSFQVIAGGHNQDGKDYKTGDTVTTHLDLVKMFPLKFKEVEAPVASAPVAAAPASAPAKTSSESAAVPPAAAPATPAPTRQPVQSALGTDVTEKFPSALEADYVVFQKGKKFFVAEPPKFDKALHEKGLAEGEVADFVADLIK